MALDQDMERLALIPLFSIFDSGALRLLAFSGEPRQLRDGDVLFREGDPADGAYFIRSGSLLLETASAGHAIAEAGTLVGETTLLRSTARPATATAREPTGLLRFSRFLFHRVLMEHAGSAERLRAFLATRLRDRLSPDGTASDSI